MEHPILYKGLQGISNSEWKVFEKNPWLFYQVMSGEIVSTDKYSEAMQIGDLTELFLVCPERFKELFVTIKDAPAGRVKDILDNVYTTFRNHPALATLTLIDEEVLQFINLEIQTEPVHSGWKHETQIAKIFDGNDYFKQLVTAGDRKIVSDISVGKAGALVAKLRNSDRPEIIEFLGNLDNAKDMNVSTAHPINASVKVNGEDVWLRGLEDVRLENETSITVTDIKTSESFEAFESQYIDFRYFRQACQYTTIEKLAMMMRPESERKRIMPFQFLVISKAPNEGCRMYTVSEQDMQVAYYGGTSRYGEKIKGLKELMEEYVFHISTGMWDMPAEYYQSNAMVLKNLVSKPVPIQAIQR